MRRYAGLVVAAALGFVAGRALPDALAGEPDDYAGLDVYARVLGQVERSALSERPVREWVYASLRGLAGSVDAHSAFFDPPTWARMVQDAEGAFAGVGVVTESERCGQRIVRVVPGGPAERAGLRVGECIEAVGETSLVDLAAEDAHALLVGEEGAARTLAVSGEGPRRWVAVVLTRTPEPSVVGSTLPDGTRLLSVVRFDPGAAAALGRATEGAPRIVLDLRGNPGGRLDEAVAMADLFLSEGVIVRTTGRAPGTTREWRASPSPGDLAEPLVVLVGAETASAAEIVAGALQAAGRAALVGRPTRGKGTVQSLFRYEDGSALRLTDATWALADGRSPAPGAGLLPTHPVPVGGDDVTHALRALSAP